MERYDSYKDSGVEWIGEIPSHWIKSKLNVSLGIKSRKSLIFVTLLRAAILLARYFIIYGEFSKKQNVTKFVLCLSTYMPDFVSPAHILRSPGHFIDILVYDVMTS